ncbi:MAG: hypothetical protein HOW73_09065 [Polyangiaceae bacterium]|nr:hypothetical protein [Polyangiaceae bacterium]
MHVVPLSPMRRCAWLLFALASCGPGATASDGPQAMTTASANVINAEPVDLSTPSPFGRVVSIGHTSDEDAYWIDEAGNIEIGNSPLFSETPARIRLPFSQPVRDVVYLGHAESREVKGVGDIYCARTRAATVECVTDFTGTNPDGSRKHVVAYRFALPTAGQVVTHLGVAPAPQQRQVCARSTSKDGASPTGTCWAIAPDGKTAVAYPSNRAAESYATGIDTTSEQLLEGADASFDVGRSTKVVATKAHDLAKILGVDSQGQNVSVAVTCALDESSALFCAGPGVYGELGDGKLSLMARASRPLGATPIVDVAATGRHVCAVANDGRIACWGKLPDTLKVADAPPRTKLPMCPLERAASRALFDKRLAEALAAQRDCNARCSERPVLDCNLNCVVPCMKPPYIFDHKNVCQEPYLDTVLAQRFGDGCVRNGQTAVWLDDAELAREAPEVELTLSPAWVAGVIDATSVAIYGRDVCFVGRGGDVKCVKW